MNTPSRLNKMIVRVPMHIVWDAFFALRGTLEFVIEGAEKIPPDVQVLTVHANWEQECFDFIVAHESFPRHAEGSRLQLIAVYFNSRKVERRKFKKGDTVFHRPTRETWSLIENEHEGHVKPGGFPPSRARAEDCILIEEAAP